MRKDDETSRRVTVSLPESLVETIDGAVEDAPDWLSLSRSELLSYAVESGVEEWDDEVLDLVPDALLARYRTKRETSRIKAEHYVVDKREGWRGRVKSYLNARLAGEEPYHPRGVELLAEGYRDELEMLDDLAPESSRSVGDDLDWLDQRIDGYRDAWQAKQALPDSRPFEGVEDQIETGSDLLSLRGRFGEVVASIEERATGDAYDPDSVVRALAGEFAVSEDAIEIVLDVLLPDDVDVRRALKDLETEGVESVLPADVVGSTEIAIEEEPVEDTRSATMDDQPAQPLAFSAEDLDLADDREVDEQEVERVVSEVIRSEGGQADD